MKSFLRRQIPAYEDFMLSPQPDGSLQRIRKVISEGARLMEETNEITFVKLEKPWLILGLIANTLVVNKLI